MTELEQDLPSSDESDEDFVPSGEDNLPSEEDSNSEDEEEQTEGGTNKRSKHSNKSKKRKRQEATIESIEESKDTKNEKPKLSTEDLWKEFISNPKDSKPEKAEESTLTPEVKTVTQVFKFAGEQVKVEKQIPVSSRGRGRGRGGGLSGILGTLGKQPKLSILDKSKLDWNQYKQAEGLEEELSTFNKGKDGYLEKQDFLQRTDLRQFEKEKELRNATRKTLR